MKCDTEKCAICGVMLLVGYDDYMLEDGTIVCLDHFYKNTDFGRNTNQDKNKGAKK